MLWNKVFGAFILLAIVAAASFPLFAQDSETTVAMPLAVRRALCRVEIDRSAQRQVMLEGALIDHYLTVRQTGTFLGVAVDEEGHILLLVPPLWNDLAQTSNSVRVYNTSRDFSPAKVIGIDHRHSLVVLRALTPTLFQPIVFEAFPENPNRLRYVRWTSPIVVHLRESDVLKVEKFVGLSEWRVSLGSQGDLFGAPLFDERGRMTGMIAELDPVRGQYYVIPSSAVQNSLKRILRGEQEIAAGWAGIFLEEARNSRYPVLVRDLTPDGPASKKLRAADQIYSVNGTPIDSMLLFVKMIRENPPFSLVRFGIHRTGKLVKTAFELGLRREKEAPVVMMKREPNAEPALQATPVMVSKKRMRFSAGLFFTIKDDTRSIGLAVSQVVQGQAGDKAGVEPGDVLLSANGYDLRSVEDWSRVLTVNPEDILKLKIRRDGKVLARQLVIEQK